MSNEAVAPNFMTWTSLRLYLHRWRSNKISHQQ